MDSSIKAFFYRSDYLDYLVLRPLSHIELSWELTWDDTTLEYLKEDGTFAGVLNDLINQLANAIPPEKYHDNEDILAEYVVKYLNWPIKKVGSRWVGVEYERILEQGGFNDIDEQNLIAAAAGRIKAAISRGQLHFDDMEESHKKMLASVLTVILYHREHLRR